jgi:putative ABC transport system ATP-binding protein
MSFLEGGAYIELRRVEKSYRLGAVTTPVLHGLSLELARGSFTAILGPSGCGKSTLLVLLGALDRPDAGSIVVAGVDLAAADRAALSEYRRARVGFVFQSYNLLRSLTALENVEASLECIGLTPSAKRARAREALLSLGLAEVAGKFPPQLSGGQQQRVAIARAIARRPALLLADEPTGNLDREAGANVFARLRELQRTLGITTVMVTHDAKLATSADRVVRMRDGRIESS